VQLVDNEHLDSGSKQANDNNGHQVFLKEDETKLNYTKKIAEWTGNLFSIDPEIASAHCVSADFLAKKGISLKFRTQFGKSHEHLSPKM